MLRTITLCILSIVLTGCLAAKAVTTTAGVATKATVLTVKTTAKVATGTADLLVPDGEDEEDSEAEE